MPELAQLAVELQRAIGRRRVLHVDPHEAPARRASATTASRLSRHRSRSRSSPSAVSLIEMFESSPSLVDARQQIVVLAGDRPRLVGARHLLAEDVDRGQLPALVQLPDDANGIVERRTRDIARREPLHDRPRDGRQEADERAVESRTAEERHGRRRS